jgi:hypothetical protein
MNTTTEERSCKHCGNRWRVELERVVGDSVPSPDEMGTRRQTWTVERVVEGTPCDCARRVEEAAARRAEEAAKQRQRDAAATYRELMSHGGPLPEDTPMRLPDYDLGGWSDPQPLGRFSSRFWLWRGELYYVNSGEQTAVKLDRGAKLTGGELRVSDPWLLI